jgi:hypothetical protein
MPKALILLADGSEEIEFVTPYDGEQYDNVSIRQQQRKHNN